MRPFYRLALLAIIAMPTMGLADEVTSFTLDNGMEIVVIEDHRAPVVVQMVWYRTGSADELPGHSGIAHFFEHLMFKATDDLAAGEFTATVEAQGGNDNAFTSNDYTAYFQRIAADRLDLVMRMEADRMRDLQLTKEVLETEREVILEERGQRTDSDPGALLGEQMDAAQYMNHPYGIPVIGWRHEIAALNLADADAFYRANYAPNNAILIVAGDVVPQEVLALAKTHYGPLAPSDKIVARKRPTEPPQLAERRIVLADERVSEPYAIRTYLAPNRKSGDQAEAAAMTILAELLGGNATTSLMARALQFDSQTAVWSSAFYNGSSLDPQTFGLAIGPMPGVSLTDAEVAVDKVIADFIKAGVNADELDRIKTQIRASKIYGRDDAMGLAQEYGASLAIGLTIDDIQTWPDALQAVTAADVMAAATKVFDRRNAVTGWLMPTEKAAE